MDRKGAVHSLPLMSKEELADRIYDHLIEIRNSR
jgi:hypothetical protein